MENRTQAPLIERARDSINKLSDNLSYSQLHGERKVVGGLLVGGTDSRLEVTVVWETPSVQPSDHEEVLRHAKEFIRGVVGNASVRFTGIQGLEKYIAAHPETSSTFRRVFANESVIQAIPDSKPF